MKKKLVIGTILTIVFLIASLSFWVSKWQWFPLKNQAYQTLIQSEIEKASHLAREHSSERMRKDLRVLFVGDTSFGESYLDGVDFLEAKGYDYNLEKLTPLLRQADLVIANLETPLVRLTTSPFAGWKKYIHSSNPCKATKTLKNHNICAVSLANNHTMDYGVEGVRQTLEALEKRSIAWFGAGTNELQASAPLIRDFIIGEKRFRLVVVAGFEHRWDYRLAYGFYAKKGRGGVNGWTRRTAADQIRQIRQVDQHAFIVAFPHWGHNYRFKTGAQTKLAHALIDAGADLVIGHGSHILQEIEHYRGRCILYSLGNFVFNSPGRYQKESVHPFSLAARLEVSEQADVLALTLRLYPIFSDNLITNYQPYLVTAEQRNTVQRILLEHSPKPEYLQNELSVGEDEVGKFLALKVGTLHN